MTTHDLKKSDCFEIHSTEYLFTYLKSMGKEDAYDFDFQLESNFAFVYLLKNNEVILIPNEIDVLQKGFLLKNRKCLDEMVENDYFPIDSPQRLIFEHDQERIKKINLSIDYYQEYLNNRLGISKKGIDEEILQDYYSKIYKMEQDEQTTFADYLAIGTLIGEYIRREKKGKWILIKEYGFFNSYFIPSLLINDDEIFSVYDKLFMHLEWENKNVKNLFNLPSITLPTINDLNEQEFIILH